MVVGWGLWRDPEINNAIFIIQNFHLKSPLPICSHKIWAMTWGVQNVWGEENEPENAPSRKILDPPKELLVCSVVDFAQEKQSNDT